MRLSGIRISRDPSDFATAAAIEADADTVLIAYLRAERWPPVTSAEERMSMSGFLLVVDEPAQQTVAGFAHVLEVDGFIHLEQLAVAPELSRRGYGRMLVEAALAEGAKRGYREMTLRTYRNVPFNAPFYASCGFEVSEPSSAFHTRLVEVEHRLGLDEYGERIQMTASLSVSASDALTPS